MLYILHDNFVILFTIANGNDLNVMEFKGGAIPKTNRNCNTYL